MNVVVKMQKITKDEYLVLRASGNTRKEIAKLKGYPLSHLENYWLKKWGIKDQTVEEIELTAFAKQTPVEPPKTPAIEPETGDRLPEAQEPAIAPEVKSTDNEDGEIEYLRRGVDHWKSKSVEAVALAGESAEKYTSEIAKLKAENEELAAERDDFRTAAEDWESKIDMFASAILERDVEVSRLKVELDAIKAPAQIAAAAEPADSVNHPERYIAGGIECLDAIEAATVGLSGGQAYTTGTAIEYLWQWSRYGGVEDLHKARWYLDRLIGGLDNATKPTGT